MINCDFFVFEEQKKVSQLPRSSYSDQIFENFEDYYYLEKKGDGNWSIIDKPEDEDTLINKATCANHEDLLDQIIRLEETNLKNIEDINENWEKKANTYKRLLAARSEKLLFKAIKLEKVSSNKPNISIESVNEKYQELSKDKCDINNKIRCIPGKNQIFRYNNYNLEDQKLEIINSISELNKMLINIFNPIPNRKNRSGLSPDYERKCLICYYNAYVEASKPNNITPIDINFRKELQISIEIEKKKEERITDNQRMEWINNKIKSDKIVSI